jgi:hypothetical protein
MAGLAPFRATISVLSFVTRTWNVPAGSNARTRLLAAMGIGHPGPQALCSRPVLFAPARSEGRAVVKEKTNCLLLAVHRLLRGAHPLGLVVGLHLAQYHTYPPRANGCCPARRREKRRLDEFLKLALPIGHSSRSTCGPAHDGLRFCVYMVLPFREAHKSCHEIVFLCRHSLICMKMNRARPYPPSAQAAAIGNPVIVATITSTRSATNHLA